MTFQLHEQLKKDCHVLGHTPSGLLLLLDNALVPWFILVPETDETEFFRLGAEFQEQVMADVNRVSAWIDKHLQIDKLNVAMIGNKVPQMHIHIVGRRRDDYCWPGVVWAASEKEPYNDQELEAMKLRVTEALELSPG